MGPALLLLALVLGCRAQGELEVAAEPVAVEAVARSVREQLVAARSRYADGDRQAAAELIRVAYEDGFADLEDVLRAHDPQATLELEYAFGRVAVHAAARGERPVAAELDRLIADLDAAVASLPKPTGPDGQPLPVPEPTGGITTVPAD